MPQTRFFFIILMLLLCSSCAQETQEQSGQPQALVEAKAWVEAEAQGVVSVPDEYLSKECLSYGWGEEASSLEVDTGLCPFIDLAQPALVEAKAGQRLRVEWWHQDLAALTPGQGVIALSVKGKIIWQREVQIPADAAAYTDELELNTSFPCLD